MRRVLVALLLLSPPTLATSGCESAVDRRTQESGLEMWAHPVDGSWTIIFAGIPGYASNVVVRFGDGPETTFRRSTFQLPPDIEGPIDIWLLEYELRGETVRGPFRFHFDPQQVQIGNAKDALDMLGNEWFTWRRLAGKDLIDTSFVSRYSCALKRVEYGFEEEPDLELPLPPCTMSDLNFDGEVLGFPVDTHAHVVVRITYADGEQTSVHRFANPNYGTGATGPALFNRALVRSSPTGARVYLDGDEQCDAPCGVKVPVDGQAHEFRLEKEGYDDLVKRWTPKSVAERSPSFDPMKRSSPLAPSTPAPPPPSEPAEDASVPPALEAYQATSYAEAARVLEPCWRMLSDDLPLRTAQRCADAYDRAAVVEDTDGGLLASSLRAAAEVGRAWNDADAGLFSRPTPTGARRRALLAAKRAAVRKEQSLLSQRTTALSVFAHHAMDEIKDRSDCDRENRRLLTALEALPVEFDEAAMKSPTMHVDLASATLRAKSALRRAETACTPDTDDAQFKELADKMIKDAISLVIAQREHSRCTPGVLHDVCARPGGLAPHLRTVLLAAIRTTGK